MAFSLQQKQMPTIDSVFKADALSKCRSEESQTLLRYPKERRRYNANRVKERRRYNANRRATDLDSIFARWNILSKQDVDDVINIAHLPKKTLKKYKR